MQKLLNPMAWDYTAIFFNIVASALVMLFLWWKGVLRRGWNWIKVRRVMKRYLDALKAECCSLIVIGRRKGFNLADVYVALDVARSDLISAHDNGTDIKLEEQGHQRAYVLVGGPGAGKSTTVKKEILDAIHQGDRFPLLLRLRDYVGYTSIDDFIIKKLSAAGFTAPDFAQSQLAKGRCICVLDGLDEVRPSTRAKASDDINAFYHKYFTESNQLIVTCRKEAYRSLPLDIPLIMEVRPLTDEQIQRFATGWPPQYPNEKSAITFWRDLASTPRILELARSPLLLVGGLVQYTEFNAGIPEQRYEYLSKVARWLVVEWSAAQGHPPDPFRSVYDRILSRLALTMHKQQCAELPRDQVESLFSKWLPDVGLPSDESKVFLDSLATKTGVLVSHNKSFVIFAQFGLQEYFAALEIVNEMGPTKISKLEPREWWREVILLAVAQQRDPNALLDLLFNTSPLIAAASVAECPTPSISMQLRAIESCLKGVDDGEKGIAGALIPLLRKVRDSTEIKLLHELDKRLLAEDGGAPIVGICLATAGTEAASHTLAQHPEIWDKCLREASYLSSSFEKLLVQWIRSGTDTQSQKASDLIAGRLSLDRLKELVDLFPNISKQRSTRLASLVLRHWKRAAGFHDRWSSDEVPMSLASRCVPYISDREKYLEETLAAAIRSTRDQFAAHRPIAMRYLNVETIGGLIGVCLYLEDKKGNRANANSIYATIRHCRIWCRDRGSFSLFLVAPIVLFNSYTEARFFLGLIAGALLLSTMAATYPSCDVPWKRRRVGAARASAFTTFTFVIVGFLIGLNVSSSGGEVDRFAFKLQLAVLLVLVGMLAKRGTAVNRSVFDDVLNMDLGLAPDCSRREIWFNQWCAVIYAILLSALLCMLYVSSTWISVIQYSAYALSTCFFLWSSIGAVTTKRAHIAVAHAADRANKHLRTRMGLQ